MDFDAIIAGVDTRKAQLAALKAQGRQVYIYGAGEYARSVGRFLRKHGVTVSGNIVDPEFKAGAAHHTLEEVLSNGAAVSIVIGRADHRGARDKMLASGKIAPTDLHAFVLSPHYLDAIDGDFLAAHKKDLATVYERLVDHESRETFIAFIRTLYSGDDGPLIDVVAPDQYFPSFLSLRQDEIFVDGGAYDGDTLSEFRRRCGGHFRKYYAIEPDPRNYDALLASIAANPGPIQPLAAALSDQHGELRFSLDSVASTDSRVTVDGEFRVPAITIDATCPGATFIKLDIEGGELHALRGAASTIAANRPTLAISAYHVPEHLWELPRFVSAIHPDYQIRMRQHRPICTELVMYAN